MFLISFTPHACSVGLKKYSLMLGLIWPVTIYSHMSGVNSLEHFIFLTWSREISYWAKSQIDTVLTFKVPQGETLLRSSLLILVLISSTVKNSAWSHEGVLGASWSPLTKCLKWNKGEGDVALCLFEVTARFYSHRPAPLHHCVTASIQNELRKKKLFSCVFLFCPCGANS